MGIIHLSKFNPGTVEKNFIAIRPLRSGHVLWEESNLYACTIPAGGPTVNEFFRLQFPHLYDFHSIEIKARLSSKKIQHLANCHKIINKTVIVNSISASRSKDCLDASQRDLRFKSPNSPLKFITQNDQFPQEARHRKSSSSDKVL